jgi:sugar-specific transcriptional regulator TrmB
MYNIPMRNPKSHLEAFGLSEKEAAVYAAALELGAATADQLANQSSIKRSTTYLQIEQLQEKGLMSTFEQGKKTLFTPESPENLERLLEKQKKDIELKQDILKKELPQLTQLFDSAGERPVVRFYQGKEGIITMRENALHALGKGDTLKVLYSYDLLFSIFDTSEIVPFSEKREEKGIVLDLIYTRNEGKLSKETLGKNSTRRYLDGSRFPIHSDLFIYKDTLAIMALKGTVFGVEITSRALVESHRSIFNLIWQIAEME